MGKKFYAVAHGYTCGIFDDWSQVHPNVNGFRGATYKSFSTLTEAEAFLSSHSVKIVHYCSTTQVSVRQKRKAPDEESKSALVIYTDGGCRNPGTEQAIAGSGVYFGPDDPRNTSATVPGDQTSSRAELWAIKVAIEEIPENNKEEVCIITDSDSSKNLISRNWKARANLDILDQIWDLLKARNVTIQWTRGHSGTHGNEMAHQLASQALELPRAPRQSVQSVVVNPFVETHSLDRQ